MYETLPVWSTTWGNFLNMTLSGTTGYTAEEIISITQHIEKKLWRTKIENDIAREIDIDIIFFNDESILLPHITIPHPRRQERDFVLAPLVDLTMSEPYISLLKKNKQNTIIQRIPFIEHRVDIVWVLNITPDSFSDGQTWTKELLHDRVLTLILHGADIIDIGAQSTAPWSQEITESKEIERLQDIFSLLQTHNYPVQFSLDTTSATIAQLWYDAWIRMINDVSWWRWDKNMFSFIASHPDTQYVMMYAKNSSWRADILPRKWNVPIEEKVHAFFEERLVEATTLWIANEQLILDPWMWAFISTDYQDSCDMITGIPWLIREFNLPVYIWTSRKWFLSKISKDTWPRSRIWSSLASSYTAMLQWASYIRVHDVQAMKQFLDVSVYLQK